METYVGLNGCTVVITTLVAMRPYKTIHFNVIHAKVSEQTTDPPIVRYELRTGFQ